LRPHKDYWGQPAYLDQLVFVDLGDDPGAEVAAFGLAPGAPDLRHERLATGALQAARRNLVYYPPTPHHQGMRACIRCRRSTNKRVRQAMRYAVDCATVARVALGDIGSPGEHHACQPDPSGIFSLPPFERDLDKAKKMLAEAGHPDGLDVELV